MRTQTNLLACAIAASLTLGAVAAPPAHAAVDQSRSYSVDVTTGAAEGFQTAELNKGRVSWLMFNTATYDTMPNALYIDGFAGGQKVAFAGDATKVTTAKSNGADVVTLRHTDAAHKVEMVRTFTITADEITVDVRLRNLAATPQELELRLTNGLLNYDYAVETRDESSPYTLSVGGRYNLTTRFDGPLTSGTGGSQTAALGGTTNKDSRFQAATWKQTVPAGAELVAGASLSGQAEAQLRDTDKDGFPDDWERYGFTDSNGVQFPLNRWGADPNRPDLFLQLNWMKSEWESKQCSEKRKYSATEEDFAQFLECSRANVNIYRPSRDTLNDLVVLFDKNGFNLHIDAGPYYSNIPGLTERKGGATIDYAPYYFVNPDGSPQAPGLRLLEDRNSLLGDRKTVFRVGVIGDTQSPTNLSSGNGLLKDGAFYVANNYLMTSQEQLRNTILHEYGHNLGLTHSGAANHPTVDSAYLPKYQSVMNYLYQFHYFDFSHKEFTQNETALPIPKACTDGSTDCYRGSYKVAPDWPNLSLVNGEVGKAAGYTGVDDAGDDNDETAGHYHPDTDELVALAAEKNNGKAGLRVLNQPDDRNIIIANRTDSSVKVEISNLGIDLHEFTLRADYPGGTFTREYPVPGALTDNAKLPVTVPVQNTIGYKDATMPIRFRIYNKDNKLVEDTTIDFSVLNLTEAEAQKLMKELEEKNSKLLDEARKTVGAKDPNVPAAIAPKPYPTGTNDTIPPNNRIPGATGLNPAPQNVPNVSNPTTHVAGATKDDSSSGSSAGTIVAIVLAVLTLLGLGAAVATNLIQIPGVPQLPF